jgi:hypothetical protein
LPPFVARQATAVEVEAYRAGQVDGVQPLFTCQVATKLKESSDDRREAQAPKAKFRDKNSTSSTPNQINHSSTKTSDHKHNRSSIVLSINNNH